MADCCICGKPLNPTRRHYCCDACAAEGHRRGKRVAHPKQRMGGALYYERVCPDCGRVVIMHIKSKRCSACQRAADARHDLEHRQAKAAGHTRHIDAAYPCERCGQLYRLKSGKQRYCERCASIAVRGNINAAKREERRVKLADPEVRDKRNTARRSAWQSRDRACVICGRSFIPPTPRRQTCSDSCQVELRRMQQRAADLKRRDARSVQGKADREAIRQLPADEQLRIREAINARARANYARRKAAKDNKEDNK